MTRLKLKSDRHFTVKGSLWIECEGEKFFGPGPVELLERIQTTGSISKAAKEMNLSYKKAWTMVNRLNSIAKVSLVATTPGGKEGGGSIVSEEAMMLISEYRRMRRTFNEFLETQTKIFNNNQ